MHLETQIAEFLKNRRFAVVGASADRQKYGNKVLRCYLQHGLDVVAVNPNVSRVEGVAAVAALDDIDPPAEAVSIITQPAVTEQIVTEALSLGIQHLWMQPGAESPGAIAACKAAGINVIHGGPCLLVVLGYRESDGQSVADR